MLGNTPVCDVLLCQASLPALLRLNSALPLPVGRGVEVTSNDVYVVQLCDFPKLAQRLFCSGEQRQVCTYIVLAWAPS